MTTTMRTSPPRDATDGLPFFAGPQAWTGPAMVGRGEWRHVLGDDEVAELDDAVRDAASRPVDLVGMRAADFPLPRLAGRLAAIRRHVLHGPGFFLLRGVPVECYTPLESAIAFRGIGAHLGEALSQNGKGHVLGHVADLGLDYGAATTRGYQTPAELRFHTDGGDVVGLLCLEPARSGGLSRIASSTSVWNALATREPQLAAELLRPYALSRWGEVGPGERAWVSVPPFAPHAGRMIAFFVMSAIEKAQAFPDAPRLSPLAREALDAVNALAGSDSLRLDMDFRPGDTQWLCNHSVLHSRTAYEDWTEPERRRHLLRLWLACDDGPPLPAHLTAGFQGATAGGRPAGIRVPGVPMVAPLTPA
jgi:hypothetical protein